jgi:hypothetical protein
MMANRITVCIPFVLQIIWATSENLAIELWITGYVCSLEAYWEWANDSARLYFCLSHPCTITHTLWLICETKPFCLSVVLSRCKAVGSVGIATGYELDDQKVGIPVPAGSRIFTSPCRPDRLWGPPSLLYNGYRGPFPGSKAAGAWNWPLTSSQCRGQENVDLYIHSPIRLHGVVLN